MVLYENIKIISNSGKEYDINRIALVNKFKFFDNLLRNDFNLEKIYLDMPDDVVYAIIDATTNGYIDWDLLADFNPISNIIYGKAKHS